MNEPIQHASNSLQAQRAQVDAASVITRHLVPIFFGDAKTAAMKVLGG
jgi:hypothetical protein